MGRIGLCGVLWLVTLALGETRAADDFDGKVPDPPSSFTGTAPVDNGTSPG